MGESTGFEAYWEQFLRERPTPSARMPHLVAAGVTVGLAAVGVATRRITLVLAAPLVGYAISTGARLVSGRQVAWPYEALRADLRLLWKTLDGTLAADIASAAGASAPGAGDAATNLNVN